MGHAHRERQPPDFALVHAVIRLAAHRGCCTTRECILTCIGLPGAVAPGVMELVQLYSWCTEGAYIEDPPAVAPMSCLITCLHGALQCLLDYDYRHP